MAATRSSSMRILRAVLTEAQPTVPNKRALHLTGVRKSPAFSPTSQNEAIATFNRKSLTDLKEECRQRTISTSGSKHELVERLASHDGLQSRAFSIAMKSIVRDHTRGPLGGNSPVEGAPTRHFNTTRELKAVGDTSTIDFAFLPDMSGEYADESAQSMRIPILPDLFDASLSQTIVHSSDAPVVDAVPPMKPQIYTVGDPDGDSVASNDTPIMASMADAVDTEGEHLDPFNMTETLSDAAKDIAEKVDASESDLKRLWDSVVEDFLGEKKKIAT